VRDRVRHIAELMARLEWKSRMAEDLAARWGVTESTVRDNSAEASRLFQDALADGPHFQMALREFAIETIKEAKADGNHMAVLKGIDLLADLSGAKAATRSKTELSGPDGGPIQTAGVVVLPAIESE